MPYPIARAARALQINSDPMQQYALLLELGESVTVTTGAEAAAWLRDHTPGDHGLQTLLRSLDRGVSQGTWHDVINAAAKQMKDNDDAIPNFVAGVTSSKKTHDLVSILRDIVTERNRWAHGARPSTRGEAQSRVDSLQPIVAEMLRKLGFLGGSKWLLVRGATFDRTAKCFSVNFGVAMSDHPEFDGIEMQTGIPLAVDTVYVQSGGAFLDLTPFVVYRYCSHCHSPEMFFVGRLKDTKAVLKSFARGHEEFDASLFEEFTVLRGA